MNVSRDCLDGVIRLELSWDMGGRWLCKTYVLDVLQCVWFACVLPMLCRDSYPPYVPQDFVCAVFIFWNNAIAEGGLGC